MFHVDSSIMRWGVLLALAASLLTPQASFGADDLLTSQLVEEARQWQTKRRNDLAADTWRRILITHPEHSEALASLGWLEVRAGNISQAQALYRRAKKTGKNTPALSRLGAQLAQAAAENPTESAPTATRAVTGPSTSNAESRAATQTATASPSRATNTASKESLPVAAKTLAPGKATTEKAPKTTQAPKHAASPPIVLEPVAPPSSEIRVTPLPLPPIADNRLTPIKNGNEEEVSLKPSEQIRTTAAPATPPPASPAGRRPKPCRLPLASGQTTGSN